MFKDRGTHYTNSSKLVYGKELGEKLILKGFELIHVRADRFKPDDKVYIFVNSIALREAIRVLIKKWE